MEDYDGWTIKITWCKNPWLITSFFCATRTEAKKKFEREWGEKYEKRRRKGDLKLVKIKFVEVK